MHMKRVIFLKYAIIRRLENFHTVKNQNDNPGKIQKVTKSNYFCFLLFIF